METPLIDMAVHHVWTAQVDLTMLAGCAEAARFIADFDFDVSRRGAEAHRIQRDEIAAIVSGFVHFENGDRIEHLRLAIGDSDHRPKQRGRRAIERRLQGRSAAEDALDAVDALVARALDE